MGRAVGIDLGTSYSSVAAMIEGKPVVLGDAEGVLAHPSIVYFPEEGEPLVGVRAAEEMASDPAHGVASAKRLIGQKFDSPAVRVATASAAYAIREAPNGFPILTVRGRDYAVPQISAMILGHLKEVAERRLGETIESAVVTVPANFTDPQRESTRQAARIAGLEVMRLVSEPTAAALAFGYGKEADEYLSVYDFGGGTFDVTLLHLSGRVFHVLATGGDSFLGGDDFDAALASYAAEQFRRETGVDVRTRAVEWQRLLFVAEKAKRALSTKKAINVRLHEVAHLPTGPTDLRFGITRDQFNVLGMDLVQRSFDICDTVLTDARLNVAALQGLVLVGGCTNIPLVRQAAEHYFGRTARSGISPEYAVAVGAAIQAAALSAPAPKSASAPPSSLLLDVVPKSVGIATAGGFVEPIIRRGTPIPAQESRVYSTSRDGQTQIRIQIHQGEGLRIDENVLLGEFVVDGLPAAPAGWIDVEVIFEIDTNGLLNVTARDLRSGKLCSGQVHVGAELDEAQVAQHAARHRELRGGRK
ncbi:MAG TPA: Hsp70 family protein [Myxococcota bacterium]|jgi:molecular chaperone DnaK|nr:Hsp70 family protein [Myxococcota bacterium]